MSINCHSKIPVITVGINVYGIFIGIGEFQVQIGTINHGIHTWLQIGYSHGVISSLCDFKIAVERCLIKRTGYLTESSADALFHLIAYVDASTSESCCCRYRAHFLIVAESLPGHDDRTIDLGCCKPYIVFSSCCRGCIVCCIYRELTVDLRQGFCGDFGLGYYDIRLNHLVRIEFINGFLQVFHEFVFIHHTPFRVFSDDEFSAASLDCRILCFLIHFTGHFLDEFSDFFFVVSEGKAQFLFRWSTDSGQLFLVGQALAQFYSFLCKGCRIHFDVQFCQGQWKHLVLCAD